MNNKSIVKRTIPKIAAFLIFYQASCSDGPHQYDFGDDIPIEDAVESHCQALQLCDPEAAMMYGSIDQCKTHYADYFVDVFEEENATDQCQQAFLNFIGCSGEVLYESNCDYEQEDEECNMQYALLVYSCNDEETY